MAIAPAPAPTTPDPFDQINTQYGGTIKTLYDNLKTALQGNATAGLAQSKSLSDHLNDALNASQAQTTGAFNSDIAAQEAAAKGLGAVDAGLGGVGGIGGIGGLAGIRDRLVGIANTSGGAAVDRNNYIGGLQSDYLNRLADSALTTGATRQADLISGVGKIRADMESKLAQLAAQAAIQKAASRRGGGGGGSSATTSKSTATETSGTNTNQNLTNQAALAGLSPEDYNMWVTYQDLNGSPAAAAQAVAQDRALNTATITHNLGSVLTDPSSRINADQQISMMQNNNVYDQQSSFDKILNAYHQTLPTLGNPITEYSTGNKFTDTASQSQKLNSPLAAVAPVRPSTSYVAPLPWYTAPRSGRAPGS